MLSLRVTVVRLEVDGGARALARLTWAAHLHLSCVGSHWGWSRPESAGKGRKQVPKPVQLLTGLGFVAATSQHCSLTPSNRLPADFLSKVGVFGLYQGIFLLFPPLLTVSPQ